MNDVEKDVKMALENASMEYISEIMEDVDPDAFVLPKEISTKRIKNRVMSKMNSKKGTNKIVSIARVAAASAASAAVLLGGAMVISEPVRAAVFEMFSFIPGKGIVETEQSPTADGEVKTGDYYILANESRKTESENLDIRLNNVTAKDNILEISYAVTLNKVDLAAECQVNDKFNHLDDYEGEEYRQIWADYYEKMGYAQYFEISAEDEEIFCALKTPKSSLSMNNTQLKKLSSEIIDSEAGMGDYFEIVETYDISGVDLSNISECSLSMADVKADITLEKAKAYETKEEAMNEVITVTGDKVSESTVCKPTLSGDLLSVELYYNPINEKDIIENCFPVVMADGEEIYSDIPVSMGDHAVRMEFDLAEVPGASEYHLAFDEAEVVVWDDMFTLDLSNCGYGEYNVNASYETNYGTLHFNKYTVLSRDEFFKLVNMEECYFDEMPEGDYLWIEMDDRDLNKDHYLSSFDVISAGSERQFMPDMWFLDDEAAYNVVPLEGSIDSIDTIVIANPRIGCPVNIEIPIN